MKTMIVICILASVASAAPYNAVPVGDLGGGAETTIPTVMDASGVIAGRSQDAGSLERAFYWTKAGGIQVVDVGGIASGVLDRNTAGTMVGYRQNADLTLDYWLHDGLTETPWVAPDDQQVGSRVKILDDGRLAYTIDTDPTPSTNRRVILYSDPGHWQDIGDLGGGQAEIRDGNSGGMLVGRSRTADLLWHSFYWTDASGMVEITVGIESSATAVTDDGRIVGYQVDAGQKRGWVYDHGVLTYFDPPGGTGLLYPSDINSSGMVVGQWATSKGFYWQPGMDEAALFDPIGSSYVYDAMFVNDAGQVTAMLKPIDPESPDPAYFLESGVPEPATMVLLASGAVLAMIRRR